MAAATVTRPEPIPEPEPEPEPEPVPADVTAEGKSEFLEEELTRSLAEKAGMSWEEFVSEILHTDSWEQFEALGGTAMIAATRLKKIKEGK